MVISIPALIALCLILAYTTDMSIENEPTPWLTDPALYDLVRAPETGDVIEIPVVHAYPFDTAGGKVIVDHHTTLQIDSPKLDAVNEARTSVGLEPLSLAELAEQTRTSVEHQAVPFGTRRRRHGSTLLNLLRQRNETPVRHIRVDDDTFHNCKDLRELPARALALESLVSY